MSVKLNKGTELIFEDYVDTSVVNFAIELLDDDCNALDLTVYEDFRWEFFAKRGGTLIHWMDLNSGLTVLGNTITMNRSYLYSRLRKGLTYYHHLIGVRKLVGNQLTKEEDVLLFGPVDAI